MLVEAGRREEADALYAELRRRDPDDVWLYNSAGFIYAGVDDREALRWCLDRIDVAITTGDPDQVVTELLDMTERLWETLGESADQDLIERVEAFTRSWTPPARLLPRWAEPEQRETTPPTAMPLAVAWFPADQWPLASGAGPI